MSGNSSPSELEQMLELSIEYVETDLDEFSLKKISGDLKFLELFTSRLSPDSKSRRIQGLTTQLIPHMYMARGYANPNPPRPVEYYFHMQEARKFWRRIRGVIELEGKKFPKPNT
jgi:hypothetical protein